MLARLRGHFVLGKAVDLVLSERLVEVETQNADGTKTNVYIPCVFKGLEFLLNLAKKIVDMTRLSSQSVPPPRHTVFQV